MKNMKENIRKLRGLALLAAVGLLCVSAGSAHAQRGGGRGGRGAQFSRAATSTGTGQSSTSGQTGTSASGQTGSCPANGSQSGSTGTSTATGSTGVTPQSTAIALRQDGRVTAQRVAANSATVQWSGSTANVQQVYLAVLDANGNVVSQTAVTPSRASASLALNSSARYYGAMVVYANGTSRTTFTPVR